MTIDDYEERLDLVRLALDDAIQIADDSATKSTTSLITAIFNKLLDTTLDMDK